MDTFKEKEPEIISKVEELIRLLEGDPLSFQGQLVGQMIQNALKLIVDGHDNGQLKLMNRALKEMRYAYRIFNQNPARQRISIFGSARTPEDHPDYQIAKAFSQEIAHLGWKCMTGAADGIMKAGLEGALPESSFGLSIHLPFESTINSVIEGNARLITFRYFFTRKLMFMSHSDAAAVFPGGFGTLDELFEFLTLMQTGKTNIIPLVLLEGEGGSYWQKWEEYIQQNLLGHRWISPADKSFYYRAYSVADAIAHLQQFYLRYHSCRYVKDFFVVRLKNPLTVDQVKQLNSQFALLVREGAIEQRDAFEEENDHLDLPRLAFVHTRKNFGVVRQLIDQINAFPILLDF